MLDPKEFKELARLSGPQDLRQMSAYFFEMGAALLDLAELREREIERGLPIMPVKGCKGGGHA